MSAGPDPYYDPRNALLRYAPGIVLSRDIELELVAQYAANGFTPLTEAQVLAIVGPLPALPTLKRFADSNPSPVDGWSIEVGLEAAPAGGPF